MQFHYPNFLYALALLAIPVLIHLFNFRRYKKVYFTNILFLKELSEKSQAKNKLRKWLILLSRLFALSFLVMAFAQPFVPLDNFKKSSNQEVAIIGVYLDNSFSMDGENTEGKLFDQAKFLAQKTIEGYSSNAKYIFIDNQKIYPQLLDKNEIIREVEECQIGPLPNDYSKLIQNIGQFKKAKKIADLHLYLISDFQHNSNYQNQEMKQEVDSNLFIYALPLKPTKQQNLYIDSCWFEEPFRIIGEEDKIWFRIVNESEESQDRFPVELIMNDRKKSVSNFYIKGNTYVDTFLVFSVTEPGTKMAELRISDFPITFDNNYFFSYQIDQEINVLTIKEGEDAYISKLYEAEENINYQSIDYANIDYNSLASYDVIILLNLSSISSGLANTLSQEVSKGKDIIVFPGLEIDMASYNLFFDNLGSVGYGKQDTSARFIQNINVKNYVFNDVFEQIPRQSRYGKINNHYTLHHNSSVYYESLITLNDNAPILINFKKDKGNVYSFLIPIGKTQGFQYSPLFVTSLLRMTYLSSKSNLNAFEVGYAGLQKVNLNYKPNSDSPFHIKDVLGKYDIIPEAKFLNGVLRISDRRGIDHAGNYCITHLDSCLMPVSYNYSRRESVQSFYKAEQIPDVFPSYTQKMRVFDVPSTLDLFNVQDQVSSKELWWLFMLFCFLFLAVEAVLIRFIR